MAFFNRHCGRVHTREGTKTRQQRVPPVDDLNATAFGAEYTLKEGLGQTSWQLGSHSREASWN